MMLNEDYKEMLLALSGEKVRYLLVGAYAMAAHGYPRATMDIDLWVEPSHENAEAVLRALRLYGAPLHDLTIADLVKDNTVFQIGVAPRRIDIVTGATGLTFDEAYANSIVANPDGIELRALSLDDLIKNKKATNRAKDQVDVELLESEDNTR